MFTHSRPFTLLALALLSGCGGSRGIGNEAPCSNQLPCPGTQVCDVDSVCRDLCGPNAPGGVCPAGTLCVSFVCRPTCSPTMACPSGLTCGQQGTQQTVCIQNPCSATQACPQRQACVSGTCQQIGRLCGDGGSCQGASEYCDQGVCRIWCGANYPNNFCATGESCLNSVCR